MVVLCVAVQVLCRQPYMVVLCVAVQVLCRQPYMVVLCIAVQVLCRLSICIKRPVYKFIVTQYSELFTIVHQFIFAKFRQLLTIHKLILTKYTALLRTKMGLLFRVESAASHIRTHN
jgi:hypothetical protein